MTIFRLGFITLIPLLGLAFNLFSGSCVAQTTSIPLEQDPPPSVVISQPVSDEGDPTKFLTGSRLESANERGKSVTWQSSDLRTRLQQVSLTQSIGVFLDRRSNGQRSEDLVVRNATTEQMLWQLATTHDVSLARVGNVYYFGPPEYAAALPTQMEALVEETAKKRKGYRVDWRKSVSLKTGSVVIARELIQTLAEEHGFEILNLEVIPHDVWVGFELPPMSLTELLQLIVVGFGKTIQRSEDGSQVTLVAFTIPETIERAIYLPGKVKSNEYETAVAKWQNQFAAMEIKQKGKKLTVKGPLRDFLDLEMQVVAMQVATDSSDPKAIGVYSLSVTASRIGILREVAKQNGLELSHLAEHKGELEQRVSIDVKNVTVDVLLFEILKGTQLRANVEDKTLQISDR